MSTERWVRCALGHEHWGSAGASGLLLAHDATDGAWVLLQHRAAWVHHGDTWSVPGGAIREGETAVEATFREVREETGLDLVDRVALVGVYVDDHGGWSYSTVCGSIDLRIDPDDVAVTLAATMALGRQEQERLTWVRVADVPSLPLHPGFAASWPQVSRLFGPPAS